MILQIVRDSLLAIGAIIAVSSLVLSIIEYKRQGSQKRAEHFLGIRNRLKTDPAFQKIVNMLETDAPELAEVPFIEKREFLGALEEVALMMNSGLIRPEVAFYMFGYDSIRCWESVRFWSDVNREALYWALFRRFAERMKELEDAEALDPDKLRF